MGKNNEYVIKVEFFKPINGEKEFYFGSLKAIYEIFTATEIGCSLVTLWNSKITVENPKATNKCLITKHLIKRNPQK